MGNDLSTARLVAPGAFAINFGAQLYGMLSTPNMKQVADANHYAFSPNPLFIAGFFGPQMLLQLAWLRKLFTKDAGADPAQLPYVPIYALGNLCIAGWMVCWNGEQFALAQLLVSVNTAAQLYAVARLPPLAPASRLTHLVAKTTAGIGLLDFLDNAAVAARYAAPPSSNAQILTSAFFLISSGMSDWIMGACVVYDLVALRAGQTGPWGTSVALLAGACAAVVGIKNIIFRG